MQCQQCGRMSPTMPCFARIAASGCERPRRPPPAPTAAERAASDRRLAASGTRSDALRRRRAAGRATLDRAIFAESDVRAFVGTAMISVLVFLGVLIWWRTRRRLHHADHRPAAVVGRVRPDAAVSPRQCAVSADALSAVSRARHFGPRDEPDGNDRHRRRDGASKASSSGC